MKFTYLPSPNYRTKQTTTRIMQDVTLCLLAVSLFSVIWYWTQVGASWGLHILLLLVVAVVTAIVTEALYYKAIKKNVKESIMSSYPWVTAIILVLITRANMSWYAICISTAIAIFFGKLVFGGFGQNIFNPAAFGEAIVMNSFGGSLLADFTTAATPTMALNSYGWIASSSTISSVISSFGGLGNLFLGNYVGTIGSTCAVLLLIIGAFLVWRQDIDWRLPVFYLGTVFVIALVTGLTHGVGAEYALFQVLTGGVCFGAVFMITDPVTNPISIPGKIVFAVGAACLTMIIRMKSNLTDGVLYSILLMNMLTPAIDKMFDRNQIKDAGIIRRNTILACGISLLIALLVGGFLQGETPQNAAAIPSEQTVLVQTNSGRAIL